MTSESLANVEVLGVVPLVARVEDMAGGIGESIVVIGVDAILGNLLRSRANGHKR